MKALHPVELHRLFAAAYNAGDLDAMAALYEPTATLVFGGVPVFGRDAIRMAYESILQTRGSMTLETAAVIDSTGDLTLLHGRWIIERPGGVVARGISAEVVRRQPDGSWLFVIDNPAAPA